MGDGRCEAQLHAGDRRRSSVDGEPHEADKRVVLRNSSSERFLVVPNSGRVGVTALEDRQVPRVQTGRRQAGKAGSVTLTPVHTDINAQLPPVNAFRDDLTSIGDVEGGGARTPGP